MTEQLVNFEGILKVSLPLMKQFIREVEESGENDKTQLAVLIETERTHGNHFSRAAQALIEYSITELKQKVRQNTRARR